MGRDQVAARGSLRVSVPADLPLAGIRVIDLTRLLPGVGDVAVPNFQIGDPAGRLSGGAVGRACRRLWRPSAQGLWRFVDVSMAHEVIAPQRARCCHPGRHWASSGCPTATYFSVVRPVTALTRLRTVAISPWVPWSSTSGGGYEKRWIGQVGSIATGREAKRPVHPRLWRSKPRWPALFDAHCLAHWMGPFEGRQLLRDTGSAPP